MKYKLKRFSFLVLLTDFFITNTEPVGMSFITFDYRCTACNSMAINLFVRRSEMDAVRCEDCGELMKRLPAGPTTTFKFGDRSAIKSRKAVSLRDPNHSAGSRGHSSSLD